MASSRFVQTELPDSSRNEGGRQHSARVAGAQSGRYPVTAVTGGVPVAGAASAVLGPWFERERRVGQRIGGQVSGTGRSRPMLKSKRRRWLAVGCVVVLAALSLPVAAGTTALIFGNGFEVNDGAGQLDPEAAARLLDQATYGGRLSDIAQLQALGVDAWLDAQFAAPISRQQPYLDFVRQGSGVYQQHRLEAWFIHSAQLADPSDPGHAHGDQLRQRVAFALSEVMVVSDRNAALLFQPWALASYYDMLAQHAFGNYRELLEDVTLHPAMGRYLSMLGNRKTDVALNIRPDENYAREILQLFSIGLHQLNLDGSRVLDGNGQPIPTYTQDVVRGFAHVFTGWNFDDCSVPEYDDCAPGNPYESPWFSPMQPIEAFHDNTTNKQLLNYPGVSLPGGVLMAGGDARSELEAALDNIFMHPNVGPFMARHLIQRLVTSNPTPGYVQRVASVFNNNGAGVRGDLGAMVRAILKDSEARHGPQLLGQDFGKLREPLTKLVRLWRNTDARSENGRVFQYSHPEDEFGQLPLSAPSVFNFFKPDFAQPGEIRDAGLVSPEFQIHTDTQLVTAPNALGWRIFYFYVGTVYSVAQAEEETLMDYGPLKLLAANPAALIDHLDLVMMSGQMSDYMRATLLQRLTDPALPDRLPGQPDGAPFDLPLHRVQQALYLIVTSPEFSVQK